MIIKRIIIAFLFFNISTSFAKQEILPIQKIKDQEINNEVKLNEVEQANIIDIYNKKIEYPQFEMGLRYYNGSNGLEQSYDKAIFWFSNSSREENNSNADMIIASMYYEGKGFDKDKVKAVSFYNRAANRDNLTAKLILTGIYFFNQDLMNQKHANYWIYKAIESNSLQAINLKSLILLNNEDYNTIKKLMPLYELNEKDELSNFTLGYLYFTGKGVEQNFEKSKLYLERSAKYGNPISVIMLEEIGRFQ